jgi:hypothetical protein
LYEAVDLYGKDMAGNIVVMWPNNQSPAESVYVKSNAVGLYVAFLLRGKMIYADHCASARV